MKAMRTPAPAGRSGMTAAACLALTACLPAARPAPAPEKPGEERQAEAPPIPEHPSSLEFPPLDWEAPAREAHRHDTSGGVPVYAVEDHALPLVEVSVLFRAGSYLDPEGQEGLAAAVGSQLRRGGTESFSPAEVDEEIEFLAARVSVSIGETRGTASLDCLAKDLDRVLELFFDMLRRPRFDPERLALYKERSLQALERRNDSASSVEAREWARLLRGPGHYEARQPTRASVEGITREDLRGFHRRWVHPESFVIAVSGDIDTQTVIAKLEDHLEGWPEGESPPPVPAPEHDPPGGVFIVDKSDVNQGRVSLGHPAVRREHPDHHALVLMNHILGGGGFTSRITSRVRSDEGLAYSAGSRYRFGVYHEGLFRASFQSKSASVARAAEIVVDEIGRMREELVSEKDLEEAVQYFAGALPRRFATASQKASQFAQDELEGRDPRYWQTFLAQAREVTPEDVRRVAREHLHPDRLTVVVVGDAEAILAGDRDHPEASLDRLAGPGGVARVPLPDPATLEYPEGTPGPTP